MAQPWILVKESEEEKILGKKEWPSKKTLDELIFLYMPQIKKRVPLYYKNFKIPKEDLVQECFQVLYEDYEKFDPSRASFCMYANFKIRRMFIRFFKVNRDPVIHPEEKSRKAHFCLSLNRALKKPAKSSIYEDRNLEWIDILPEKKELPDYFFWGHLKENLEKKEAEILWLKFQGYIEREIAKEFGVSRQRINQIEKKAHKKLKEVFNSFQEHL